MSSECDSSLTTMDWLSAVDVQIAPAKNELLESSLSLTNPSSSKDPFEDFRPFGRETGKPSHSYSTLIKFAISSTRSKRMSLRQIYKWISDNFPYYKDARNGWKNSIRHNLSLNKCFIKVPRDKGDMGKGCYWSLREGYRPESTPTTAGMRMPTITVTSASNTVPHHGIFSLEALNSGSEPSGIAILVTQTPQQPAPASLASQSGLDTIPELTDSTVGALAALMGSQSDQVLGAALAPAVASAQATEQLPESSMMQQQSQPDPSPCLSLSPPSAGTADQLSLSASLQTICRSLLGESSSGGSSGGVGIGAFASVETGGSSGGSSASAASGNGGGASCSQAPDLSASTLDFVQRMLPQLKDSFQLSDSALHDLWDHCRSASSRPVTESAGHQGVANAAPSSSGVILLPTGSDVRRFQSTARPPPQTQARPQPPPPPPPRWGHQPVATHRPAMDPNQDVEDDFNWDSIL